MKYNMIEGIGVKIEAITNGKLGVTENATPPMIGDKGESDLPTRL